MVFIQIQPPGEPQEHYLDEVRQKQIRATQNFIKKTELPVYICTITQYEK